MNLLCESHNIIKKKKSEYTKSKMKLLISFTVHNIYLHIVYTIFCIPYIYYTKQREVEKKRSMNMYNVCVKEIDNN